MLEAILELNILSEVQMTISEIKRPILQLLLCAIEHDLKIC